MSEPLTERRMAENQVVFRKHNEAVQKSFDELNAIAAEEGANPVQLEEDSPLFFFCECSDESCRTRIKVTPKDYNKIHTARNRFVIVCGHEVSEIEDVTAKTPEYCVVTKHVTPPQSAAALNPTDVTNV
jgi:hypothetical protein